MLQVRGRQPNPMTLLEAEYIFHEVGVTNLFHHDVPVADLRCCVRIKAEFVEGVRRTWFEASVHSRNTVRHGSD